MLTSAYQRSVEMAKPDLSEFILPRKCVIGELSLSKEQWEKLNFALEQPNRDIQTTTIMDVLSNWGHPVKRTSLSAHRRGQCRCENK